MTPSPDLIERVRRLDDAYSEGPPPPMEGVLRAVTACMYAQPCTERTAMVSRGNPICFIPSRNPSAMASSAHSNITVGYGRC